MASLFWGQANAEPKRQFRFELSFTSRNGNQAGDIPVWTVKTATKPVAMAIQGIQSSSTPNMIVSALAVRKIRSDIQNSRNVMNMIAPSSRTLLPSRSSSSS